jgi:hypothetical protein
MSQILAIRGEVRNHPLTFEFAIEYNKGVGSRRTAPAQGIETVLDLVYKHGLLMSRRTAPAQGIETQAVSPGAGRDGFHPADP